MVIERCKKKLFMARYDIPPAHIKKGDLFFMMLKRINTICRYEEFVLREKETMKEIGVPIKDFQEVFEPVKERD